MLARGLLCIVFIMLMWFSIIPNVFRAFFLLLLLWWNVELWQRHFGHLLRWSRDFCPCIFLRAVSYTFIYFIHLFIDLYILNDCCIPGMKPTWLWSLVIFKRVTVFMWQEFMRIFQLCLSPFSLLLLYCCQVLIS